jgi:hypothetical protein
MLILYRKQVDETVHEIQSQSEEEKITQKVKIVRMKKIVVNKTS